MIDWLIFVKVADPLAAANVPGAHGAGAVEPVAHEAPMGQSVQAEGAASPVLLDNVPARHGSSADAP